VARWGHILTASPGVRATKDAMTAYRLQPRFMRRLTCGVALSFALATRAQAQDGSPREWLRAWDAGLFGSADVVDAAEGGVVGARIVRTSSTLEEHGFQSGDVVVAVEGRALLDGLPQARPRDPTYTVLRAVGGERPVLTADVLGLQVLRQFTTLDAAERTPIRLARMVANQQTLVRDGIGVVLVPVRANGSDSEWVRVANPLPAVSETALRDVADAVIARTSLAISTNEAEAAHRALGAHSYFEARERAARALLTYVTHPDNRGVLQSTDDLRSDFDALVQVFRDASRGVDDERRVLMATGSRLGLYVQTAFHHVKENLPQNTMLILDGSNSVSISAGIRTGLFWPSERGGWPVWRDLHLLTSYGYSRHTFSGPPAQQQPGSEPRMRTRLHRLSAELMYRPRVLSRLRPHFRGGPAAYHVTAGAYDTDDRLRHQHQSWELGWILGGGIDAFASRTRRYRLTVTADYQIVSTRFCDHEAPQWIEASNIIEQQQVERPVSLSCGGLPSDPEPYYEVSVDGFQIGLALAYEF